MEQDEMEMLLEFICDKRCHYTIERRTYRPNNVEAATEQERTKCAACMARMAEIRERKEQND